MKRCSTIELREKEIINLCDGLRLGYADDFEFDLNDGRITALILGKQRGFLFSPKMESLRIPWDRIECIGEDTILVKINVHEAPYCNHFKRNDERPKLL